MNVYLNIIKLYHNDKIKEYKYISIYNFMKITYNIRTKGDNT